MTRAGAWARGPKPLLFAWYMVALTMVCIESGGRWEVTSPTLKVTRHCLSFHGGLQLTFLSSAIAAATLSASGKRRVNSSPPGRTAPPFWLPFKSAAFRRQNCIATYLANTFKEHEIVGSPDLLRSYYAMILLSRVHRSAGIAR